MKNITKLIVAGLMLNVRFTKAIADTVAENVEPIKGLITDCLELAAEVKSGIDIMDKMQNKIAEELQPTVKDIVEFTESELERLKLVSRNRKIAS